MSAYQFNLPRRIKSLLILTLIFLTVIVIYLRRSALSNPFYNLTPLTSTSFHISKPIFNSSDLNLEPSTTPSQPNHLDRHHSQSLFNRIKPYLLGWEDRPVTSYEVALLSNQHACGTQREHQSNLDQLRNQQEAWEQILPETIHNIRTNITAGVRQFFKDCLLQNTNPINSSHSNLKPVLGRPLIGTGTKGIVIAGGNTDTMRRMMTMLRILRKRYDCRLPVEIFMFQDEVSQVAAFEPELRSLGQIEIKQLPYEKEPGAWKNFHIKGASIIHSTFTQVLYLDSDNIPLVDPTFLFDSPVFKEWGMVLWPDITKDGAKNPIWRIAGTTCIPQDWQIDSGQILVDKAAQKGLVFGALLVAAEMQLKHDFWFRVSEGDKDTFRYALYALQLPWTRAPHWVSSAGSYKSGSQYCGHTMFQYSLSPTDWKTAFPSSLHATLSTSQRQHAPPLFAHINLLKHTGGFKRGETFDVLQRLAPNDLVTRSNLNISDQVRTRVIKEQGMCVHYAVENKSVVESLRTNISGKDQSAVINDVWIVEEDWKDAWGGLLKDFEAMYWENGGI